MATWADAAFQIGSSHFVCEDYACEMGGLVALSDGCSGADNTDVGARLLARTSLRLAYGRGDFDSLGRHAAIVARSTVNALHTGPDSLLATLLLARPTNLGGFEACCWGDGIILFCVDGEWSGWHIQWPGERPLYPVLAGREADFPAGSAVSIGSSLNPDGESLHVESFFSDARFDANAVVLLSDGFTSFYDDDRRPVPLGNVLAELLPFRSGGPAFVRRRLAAFVRRCDRLGWGHYDDISAAAIWDKP